MKINYTAPINQLGYGIVGVNILKSLCDLGHDVALWPISQIEIEPSLEKYIKTSYENQNTYSNTAPSIRLWHQFDMAQHIGKGPHIGYPIFELDNFTDREKHHLNSQDVLFVCSEWAKEVVSSFVNTPVSVIPLGVDRSIFHEGIIDYTLELSRIKELVSAWQNNKIFINVGKWEVRKGHDVLVDIFNSAFTDKDDVELWMVCSNPFLNEQQEKEWINLYKNSKLGHKIRILPRLTSQQDLAIIMTLADIGVFPARAEGWNLDALELMSCGKTVISTDYAAHKDFMLPENLVEITSKEIAYDGIWFHGQGSWAKIDKKQMDTFVDLMKYHYKKERNICKSSIEQAKKFSWHNAATKIVDYIDYVN